MNSSTYYLKGVEVSFIECKSELECNVYCSNITIVANAIFHASQLKVYGNSAFAHGGGMYCKGQLKVSNSQVANLIIRSYFCMLE